MFQNAAAACASGVQISQEQGLLEYFEHDRDSCILIIGRVGSFG